MTAKEFLRQYEHASRIVQRCKTEYETEVEKIDAIGSTLSGDGMPHGSGISRKTEDKAIRLAEKATRWKAAELDAIAKRQEVFEVIYDIKGIEGDVLIDKYINLKTWEQIAEERHYTVRGIQYAHGRALLIVAKRIK